MNGAIRLGRLAGVNVVADSSAFLLALLFGGAVFIHLGRLLPDTSPGDRGAYAVAAGVLIIGCIFLHEASHVVVALRRGMKVRSIRLNMFGGYSVMDGVPSPRTEFLVSMAGPTTSVLIGLAALTYPYFVGTGSLSGATLWTVGIANVAIGLFNLLPGFPLDGGRAVRSVLARGGRDRVAATHTAANIGRLLGYTTMAGGAYLLATKNMEGLIWVMGGWFLASTASTAGRREELSAAFDGMTVGDVMRETPDAVSGNDSISTLIALYAFGPNLRSIPVAMSGRVVGVIGQDEIDSVAPARWPAMRVRALMSPIGPADVVEADAPLETLMLRPAGASGRAVAVRDGTVVGIVDGQALASVLGH